MRQLATPTAIGLGIFVLAVLIPSGDPDTYWHFASARWMLDHGEIMRRDVFTSTVFGQPYNVGEWLGELVFYASFLTGGWRGVVLLRALLAAGSAFFLARVARRTGAPLVSALIIVVWALVLAKTRWADRPQTFSVLFFPLVLDLLFTARSGRVWPLVLLPPLMSLWANLHGGYALGLGVTAAFAVEAVVTRSRVALPMTLATLCAAAASQLTPFGLGIGGTASHALAPPRFISEESPPDVRDAAGLLFSLFVVATIAAAAIRRPSFLEVLIMAPLLWLGLSAQRHMAFFAMAATPYLAAAGADAWRRLPVLQGPLAPMPRQAIGAVLGVLLLLATAAAIAAPAAPNEVGFPRGAVADLERGGGTLLNEYDWGGYIEWYVPSRPAFIDGRLFPFLPAVLADYNTMIEAEPGWRAVIDRRGIREVLIKPTRPLAGALEDEGWAVVARNDDWIYLARR